MGKPRRHGVTQLNTHIRNQEAEDDARRLGLRLASYIFWGMATPRVGRSPNSIHSVEMAPHRCAQKSLSQMSLDSVNLTTNTGHQSVHNSVVPWDCGQWKLAVGCWIWHPTTCYLSELRTHFKCINHWPSSQLTTNSSGVNSITNWVVSSKCNLRKIEVSKACLQSDIQIWLFLIFKNYCF